MVLLLSLVLLYADVDYESLTNEQLVQTLGSREFAVREKAQELLISNRFTLAFFFELRKRQEKDPEVAYRLRCIKEKYREKLKKLYVVDLKGYGNYPQIDVTIPLSYCFNGTPWEGWQVRQLISHYRYYAQENNSPPKFLNDRKAMELWIEDRIHFEIEQFLSEINTAEEFDEIMKEKMKPIQKDIDFFIENDKQWYRDRPYVRPNPFEKKSKDK